MKQKNSGLPRRFAQIASIFSRESQKTKPMRCQICDYYEGIHKWDYMYVCSICLLHEKNLEREFSKLDLVLEKLKTLNKKLK